MNPSIRLALGGGTAVAAAFVHRFDPASGGYPPCPFRWLTGLQCPGCGSLRALHELSHLRVLDALDLNVLTVLAVAALLVGGVLRMLRVDLRRAVAAASSRVAWCAAIVLVAFGVVRNVPALAVLSA